MTFRSDGDALLARVASLESELARATGDVSALRETVAALRAELTSARSSNSALRQELIGYRTGSNRQRPPEPTPDPEPPGQAPLLLFQILESGGEWRQVSLRQSVIKIGKLQSSHLRIEDNKTSRMHAVIENQPGGPVTLIDLGSTTGTLVNGHKVNKSMLEDGDDIRVGDTHIVVHMRDR